MSSPSCDALQVSSARGTPSLVVLRCIPAEHQITLTPSRLTLERQQPRSCRPGRRSAILLVGVRIVPICVSSILVQRKGTVVGSCRAESEPVPDNARIPCDVRSSCQHSADMCVRWASICGLRQYRYYVPRVELERFRLEVAEGDCFIVIAVVDSLE